MSARTTRTRLLAATTITLAALSLTACNNGDDLQDKGSSKGAATSTPSASENSAGKAKEEAATGGGKADSAGSSNGSTGSKGSSGGTGSTGSKDSGSKGSGTTGSGTTGSGSDSAKLNPCDASNSKTTATTVSRPLNHLLLTVTNTGSKNCDLVGYPIVRFTDAQSVPPVFEESKPQAVVTLAPGESGYAGVRLSAADDSGSNGYMAKTLKVLFNNDGINSATPPLPAKGVYIDDKLTVTYWQQRMDDALTW
ncbi:DUF4232 domain-containing protein [Streptomyces sp. NBC_00878]|uniref:DUF4232 domain-containing protein n=1 Tax=Streptomyces sp. NBC_00878 TaxID=2975854 RepID=UPI0022550C8B|nr:DUF4232 domain-containing protein [Streptomyces sp. NBC_00878]MCX4907374.1 DUF4232 domain-containing protein [Streptomyces sp. NBC_00878]